MPKITQEQYDQFMGKKAKKPARRTVRHAMNKTESRYADQLEAQKRAGEIVDYQFEAVKLRIGHNCWYTPDFLVVTWDGIEFHEVKGHWREDARVKIKAAAARHRWARFSAVRWDGGWEHEEFQAA